MSYVQNLVGNRAPYRAVVAFVVFVHVGVLVWSALRHSPAGGEAGHLAAGISHWHFGRFDMFRVNPPLVRSVAAAPMFVVGPRIDWRSYSDVPGGRPEFHVGKDLLALNGERSFFFFALARWACVPFSLLGAYACFAWGRELYGDLAGVLALTLWCSSPNVVAHAQMITPDAGAAALGLAATYVFWRWLRRATWGRALMAGGLLGLAELTKTTWIVLFGLWPLLWALYRWNNAGAEDAGYQREREPQSTRPESEEKVPNREGSGRRTKSSWLRGAVQMAVILLVGLYVLNLGYGFEESFQKLGEHRFVSETLGGPKNDSQGFDSYQPRNRFAGTWLAHVPVPLPKDYLMGIDMQKSDFERKMWSYLRGQWRLGGWWYYYLYALAVKVPLGTWILALLALLVGLFRRGYAASWRDELVLLAPIAVVLTLVSSQTGFNHHLRYVLPIFPFAFIWMSKVARAFQFGHQKLAAVVVVAMAWSVGSSLWVYPHSLSYFNELVGGPTNGHAHLLNSNIDWGQDLLYLKRWLDQHAEARPLHLAFSGSYDAAVARIEYTLPPTEPRPGWHALSVNKIRSRTRRYEYFLRFRPVAMAGYSIYIYHVTLDEANRVRRELGLPELPAPQPRLEDLLGTSQRTSVSPTSRAT